MEPINYILDVKSPIEQAMKGFALGRQDIEQNQVMQEREQIMGIRGAQEARAAAQEKERLAAAASEREKADALQVAMMRLRNMGIDGTLTTDAINQTLLPFADTFEEFTVAAENIAKPVREATALFGSQVATSLLRGRPEFGVAQLNERIAAAEAEGSAQSLEEAKRLTIVRDEALIDPQGAAVGILTGLRVQGLIDDSTMDNILKSAGMGQGTADVQKAENIGGIAVVVTLTDGTVQIKDARTNEVLTGAAADKLLAEASDIQASMAGAKSGAAETARLEAQIDFGALASAAQAGGQASIKLAEASSAAVAAARSNIGTLDRAIELVEQEGANTGVIARTLPSWNASTVELNNLQGQLTVDVIGAVTFGALSEGELALAMDIALPTGLDEKELADWLRRKKTAQQKLANYHSKKARFFSDGFSVGQWEEFIESGETDMRAWMDRNVPGPRRRTTTTAPTANAPTDQGLSAEDLQYLEEE